MFYWCSCSYMTYTGFKMFEVITGSESAESTSTTHTQQRVQDVFSKAKQLRANKAELTAAELKKREVNPIVLADGRVLPAKRLVAFQIPGMDAISKDYDKNIQSLKFDDVDKCKDHISAIKENKAELESLLLDLAQQRTKLSETSKELEVTSNSLKEQSSQYAETIASGDIGAADALENTRLEQVQVNETNKQECKRKVEAIKQAEVLLKHDLTIWEEMEKSLSRHSLLQQYKIIHEKLNEQISLMTENYQALDGLAADLWGDNYDRWEHTKRFQELIHNSKDYARLKAAAIRHQSFVNSDIVERNPKFYR